MRPEKESMVNDLRSRMEESDYVLIAGYFGMDVAGMTELRSRFSRLDTRMQVVRHSSFAYAARAAGREDISGLCEGPVAMITGTGDIVEVAKILRGSGRDGGNLVPKGGCIGSSVLTAADVVQLATLPARGVLLGMAVSTIAAPMSRLAGVMRQKMASLVYALKDLERKKGL